MFQALPQASIIPAQVQHVVGLHRSLNNPALALGGGPPVECRAFVIGVQSAATHFTLYVALMPVGRPGHLLFRNDPVNVPIAQYRSGEQEALALVGRHGFVMERLELGALAVGERARLMAELPLQSQPAAPATPAASGAGVWSSRSSVPGRAVPGGYGAASAQSARTPAPPSGAMAQLNRPPSGGAIPLAPESRGTSALFDDDELMALVEDVMPGAPPRPAAPQAAVMMPQAAMAPQAAVMMPQARVPGGSTVHSTAHIQVPQAPAPQAHAWLDPAQSPEEVIAVLGRLLASF